MASPSKKRDTESDLIEDDLDDDDSSDFFNESLESDDGENGTQETENVNVDFEGNTACEADAPGIQRLLQQLFLKANINLTGVADYIIAHNYVGSVLKESGSDGPEDRDNNDDNMDEEEDSDREDTVYGVTTVVNLTHNNDLDFVTHIKSMVRTRCEKCAPTLLGKLNTILDDHDRHVGFVINERFINLPAQVSLPVFETLWKEADQASKKKLKYRFKYLMLIAKTYKSIKLPKRSKKKCSKLDADNEIIFVNQEEQLFYKEAELTFQYSVKEERDVAVDGEWDMDSDELEPTRTVIIVSYDYVPSIMAKIEEMYPVPNPDT